MTMYDRETGSVWHHFNGKASNGYYQGEQLKFLPVQMMTWTKWQERYPDTLVLDDRTGFEGFYRVIEPATALGATSSFVDYRLPPNAVVLGVQTAGGDKAYPQQLVDDRGGVVNDLIGDVAVVVFLDRNGSGLAYSRSVNGQVLEFVPDGGIAGLWKDTATNTVWTSSGLAINGSLAGEKLDWLTSFVTEWYGWAEYHPATDIYGTESEWATVTAPVVSQQF